MHVGRVERVEVVHGTDKAANASLRSTTEFDHSVTKLRHVHTKEPALIPSSCIQFSRLVASHHHFTVAARMDSDAPSSPIALPSSLPPSSAPQPTSINGGTPRRPVTDALAMGGDEAEEDNQESTESRRRRRPRQTNENIPIVKDAVGESVAESFETFLKTWVTIRVLHLLSSMFSQFHGGHRFGSDTWIRWNGARCPGR